MKGFEFLKTVYRDIDVSSWPPKRTYHYKTMPDDVALKNQWGFFVVDFFGRGNSPTSQGKVTSWCFQHVQPFIFLDPGVSFPSQVFKKGSLRDILYIMSTPLHVTVTSGIMTFLLGNPEKNLHLPGVTGRVVDPSYMYILISSIRLKGPSSQARETASQPWPGSIAPSDEKKAWLFRVFVGIKNSQLCGDHDKTTIKIPIKQPGWLMESKRVFFVALIAPEEWYLEDDPFLFGMANFSGCVKVPGSVHRFMKKWNTGSSFGSSKTLQNLLKPQKEWIM